MRRRQAKEALALLEPEISASAQTPELSVWRKITQGTAEAFLLHFDRSRELLSQAEELARSTAPSLLGEIALRRGTLAFLQDDSETARGFYHQALTLSRSEHDLFLKAAALGSLGLIATREEHYDESIDWNSQALRLSQLLGAQTSVARILGNLGWSHFELGDFDGALQLYEQGAELSKKSGLLNDQIYWMVGVATAHYAKHDYATARKDLEQVLAVARGLDEKSVLLGCLNEITTVSLATGDAPAAATYNAEALQTAQAGLDPAGVMA
ncbi:MAG TPA: tetratricopeptide repeat protein, partial [Terriglobales bacterium]|nr:tetratricopeptide repeat protein [Terriglobales bacterium]